jgi:hypothetical protein
MILLVTVHLLWLCYMLFEGLREGFYWHFKNHSRVQCDYEIHPVFAAQRGIVFLITFLLFLSKFELAPSMIFTFSLMLIFSYFHNGAYYLTRHRLDKKLYPKGWKDQSITSTARMTKIMMYRNRTLLMILGYAATVATYLFLV